MLLLAACGGGSSASPEWGSGDAGLAGEIVISGSSTVEPISSIVASDFNAANPDVQYSVDGPGTGDGMALLCDGSIDIADASRAIEDEEAAICEENGINFIELQIGIDGISVITSHGEHGRHLPELCRPVCADRAGVAGLRHVGRRQRAGR